MQIKGQPMSTRGQIARRPPMATIFFLTRTPDQSLGPKVMQG